ncbi:MAG: signal peptide peptidase SppA [Candidatus Sericytochromatia bacterium]|nr:signal peptide peptidase SppA [Candidatus Tanganyikabacteria bacterium]
MRRLLPALVAVCLPAPAWAAPPDLGLIPAVAAVDDGAALLLNPAGLGSDGGASMHLASGGFQSLGSQSFSLSLGLGAGGLGVRHEPTPAGDRAEVLFASAIPLAPGFRGGFSYRLGGMAGKGGADWDLGMLVRPADWLSAGGAVRNVGGSLPGEARNYQVGIGVRPVGDRLTVTLDANWSEGKRMIEAITSLGAEFEPLDGLTLRGEASLNPAFLTAQDPLGAVSVRAGLSLATPRIDAGGLSGGLRGPAGSPPGTTPGVAGASTYLRFREARGRAMWYGAPEILDLELRGDLGPDRSALGLIAGLADKPPVASTLEVLQRAAGDPQVRGVAMTVDGVGVSLADAQEVRSALLAVRNAGKPIVAYLGSGSFLELFLASVADRILLNPVGTLDFTGFSREDLYLRKTLEKIGIKAEFVATGPYKTAMESLTGDKMSAENRRQLEELTGDQFEQIVAAVAEGRKRTPAEIREQIDRGILSAPEALQAGLVDDLQSQDATEGAAAKLAGGGNVFDAFKRPARLRSWLPPRIAVVYATGAITEGASGNDLLMGRILGQDTLIAALKESREDEQIRAVVLRVDSPGGSSLASEAIRREVERTRQEKPVIVSMGGVAASGGYWIACGTDRILADPGTITGSIGVYSGKYSAAGLLNMVGARAETVERGRFAGLGSPFHDMTEQERALLLSAAEFSYARFLELVSHARRMPQHKVKDLAGGRVYSGARAVAAGLADREGGLLDAIGEARAAAGIGADHEVEIAYLPQQRPFLLSDDPLVFFDAAAELRRAAERAARWTRAQVWLLDPRLAP